VKNILFVVALLAGHSIVAQNVGIGTTAPHPSAILDVQSPNKGVLIPKINLITLSAAIPVTSPAIGLLIYNTNNSIGEDTEASGFYFWTGTSWEKVTTSNKGAVPKDGIIEFENKQAVPGFTYIGYAFSDYVEKIGVGTGDWQAIPAIATNNATLNASCVWYDNKMFVWSGEDNSYTDYEKKGAWFTPSTNVWTDMAIANAPLGRFGNVTVADTINGWMLVWGGVTGKTLAGTANTVTNTGGRYDLIYNSWAAISNGPLAARMGQTGIWAENKMIVWGGYNGTTTNYNDGAAFNITSGLWTSLPASPLSPRYNHSAVWTGSKMIIWGGTNGSTIFNDGAAYDPATNTWTSLALGIYVHSHSAIWTGTEMIIFGGINTIGTTSRCYTYNPTTNIWGYPAPAPGETSTASTVEQHRAIWTGTNMVILGGKNSLTSFSGVKLVRSYNPATNTWQLYNDLPEGKIGLAAVWTGTEIIIQGGSYYSLSGFRFNPVGGTPTDIHTGLSRFFYKYRKD